MYKKILWVLGLLIAIGIGIFISYKFGLKSKEIETLRKKIEYYENIDSTYSHKIDSIEYNIQYRDSIIYNIKKEYIDEYEILAHNNDIDAVAEFEKLVRAK